MVASRAVRCASSSSHATVPTAAATRDARFVQAYRNAVVFLASNLTPTTGATLPVDNAGRRLMEFALEKDVHDARLWMPITRVTGALGNPSALVGTAEQVAEALLEYYSLGVHSFLIRGFDPVGDTHEFGRELIPRLKAGALAIDRQRAPTRAAQ